MISGYAAPGDIETAFKDYGLFRFISKPWDAEQLKEIILTVIYKDHE